MGLLPGASFFKSNAARKIQQHFIGRKGNVSVRVRIHTTALFQLATGPSCTI